MVQTRELPPQDPTTLSTPELIERYQRDGEVCGPNGLHPEWLRRREMGLQRMLEDPGQK